MASPASLIMLAALAAVSLYGLYPAERYLRLLEQASFDDPLTARLARGILVKRPHERQLYGTLIQAEMRRGRFDLAVELARRWQAQAHTPEEAGQAFYLGFLALREAWYAQAPNTPARASYTEALRAWLADNEGAILSFTQRLEITAILKALEAPVSRILAWLPDTPASDANDAQRLEVAQILLAAGAPELALAWLHPWVGRLDQLADDEATIYITAALSASRLDVLVPYLSTRVLSEPDPTEARLFLRHLLTLCTQTDRITEGLPLIADLLEDRPELLADRELLIELITAARAVRRPDLASRWAIWLLRLSLSRIAPDALPMTESRTLRRVDTWLTPLKRLFKRLNHGGLFCQVAWAGDRPPSRALDINLPFDDDAYALAFNALLDDKKLDEAWQVAQAAVKAVPEDPQWRLRLAQVSEWSGRPQTALEQWKWLAHKRDDPNAWEAILRLAPGLHDWEALRLAYARQIRIAHAPEDVRRMVHLLRYLGESDAACTLLLDEIRRRPMPWALEMLAIIQADMGNVEASIQTWRTLARIQPLNAEQSMHLATLLITQGQLGAALSTLEASPAPADPKALHDVLKMRLELARLLADVDAARRSFEELERTDLLTPEELDVFYALLERRAPRDAAALVSAAWSRFKRPIDLQRGFYLGLHYEAWEMLDTFLRDPEAQRVIDSHSDLLQMLAQYYLARAQPQEAKRALSRALELSPNNPEVQAATLWLLIDLGQNEELKLRLRDWETSLGRDTRWYDLLGAAYQTLSMPGIALQRYLLPQVKRCLNDPLWAMNLADALEQNGQPDQAWRIRRALWTKLKPLQDTDWLSKAPFNDMQRIVRIRLGLAADPGNLSYALLRELIRQDRNAKRELSENAKVLITAWLQDQGQFEAERAWLWSRFAEDMSRPVWADIAAALNLDDVPRIGELLESCGDSLPRYDRINALRRVHDLPAAQSAAFESQEAQRDDHALQRYLEDVILAHSDHVRVETSRSRDRLIGELRSLVGWRSVLGTRLALDVVLGDSHRKLYNPQAFGRAWDHRALNLTLEWQRHTSLTQLGAGLHQGLDDWLSAEASHRTLIGRRTMLDLKADWGQPSEVSTALRLAGRQHQLQATLHYRLSARDHFTLGAAWQAFETQTGDRVGDGQVFEAAYTHWLRIEPRDLGVDLFARCGQYDFNDHTVDGRLAPLNPADTSTTPLTGRFFATASSTEYGLRLHTNKRFAHDYSRDWRPYASMAVLNNTITGFMYDVEIGLAGSLFGTDHLNLFWRLTSSQEELADTTRQIGITYRIHY